ncbi:hypothetical protein [Pararhodobacter oceanensis]|uniref:hypothetical protein n=1 Tax=Pararhodobacter oceanensis TaxID=2172121 RepID=UPI003A8C8BAD
MLLDALSKERLRPYVLASGHNESTALELYGWNLRVSAAFYPLLATTEVVLRNAVSDKIRAKHGKTWWENDAFHSVVGGKAKGMVLRARNKRAQEKGQVSHGCMVAELTFGFWANMLLAKYERHYWTPLVDAFPDIPASVTYRDLSAKCDRVTSLRNRIFHHEPMFKRNITKDYSDTLALVSWLSPDAALWIKPRLQIMAILRQRPRHHS